MSSIVISMGGCYGKMQPPIKLKTEVITMLVRELIEELKRSNPEAYVEIVPFSQAEIEPLTAEVAINTPYDICEVGEGDEGETCGIFFFVD